MTRQSDGVTIKRTNGKYLITNDTSVSENQKELWAEIDNAYQSMRLEVVHQYQKFGDQYHTPDQWISIITEEWGESVTEWNHGDLEEAIDEAQQTMMCIVQYIHELRRLKEGKTDGEYTRQT